MVSQTNMLRGPAAINGDRLTAEDFETASIRSAAPSYTSEAPSYHSTVPAGVESIPAYTPATGSGNVHGRANSVPVVRVGLPPVPMGPPRRMTEPRLSEFRIPTWSTLSSNPTARHYQSVAQRRVVAAAAASSSDALRRVAMLDRVEEEDNHRFRPLEDPYLVGEEAAARARAERLARENGDDVLIREDRRWDWFLAQVQDWEERENTWKGFRREVNTKFGSKLAFRIGSTQLRL